MFSLEQLLSMLFIAVVIIITIILAHYAWRLERKYDLLCFIFAIVIFLIFYFFIIFSNIEQIPSLISSLVIAELTLALVWVELSKRPELKLLSFVPIIHDKQSTRVHRADYDGELSDPSTFLNIRKATYENFKFDSQFSFSVDLSNIGYQDITVHEYVVYIDGKRIKPIGFRDSLSTQERKTIDIPKLNINSHGFHRIGLEVLATTVKCSKEVWFFISEDFKKLRYVEIYPIKRLLSPLIKAKLRLSEND